MHETVEQHQQAAPYTEADQDALRRDLMRQSIEGDIRTAWAIGLHNALRATVPASFPIMYGTKSLHGRKEVPFLEAFGAAMEKQSMRLLMLQAFTCTSLHESQRLMALLLEALVAQHLADHLEPLVELAS